MILMTILMMMFTIGLLRIAFSLAWDMTKIMFSLIGFLFSPIMLILILIGAVGSDLLSFVLIALIVYEIYYILKNKEVIL